MINKRIYKSRPMYIEIQENLNDPDGMADITQKISKYQTQLFLIICLDVGEYIDPQEINKQEESKWPISTMGL